MVHPDLVFGEERELEELAGAGAALGARHVGHQVRSLGGRGREGIALHLVKWCNGAMVQWRTLVRWSLWAMESKFPPS